MVCLVPVAEDSLLDLLESGFVGNPGDRNLTLRPKMKLDTRPMTSFHRALNIHVMSNMLYFKINSPLFILVDFPIHIDSISIDLSILYLWGSKIEILHFNIFLSMKIYFILANSADPDKMSYYVAFHMGHYCLQKYGFWIKNE